MTATVEPERQQTQMVRLKQNDYDQIVKLARLNDRTITAEVGRAVREYLERAQEAP